MSGKFEGAGFQSTLLPIRTWGHATKSSSSQSNRKTRKWTWRERRLIWTMGSAALPKILSEKIREFGLFCHNRGAYSGLYSNLQKVENNEVLQVQRSRTVAPWAIKSLYVACSPSRSGVFAVQPKAVIFETSKSLRGGPSGRLVSKTSLPR